MDSIVLEVLSDNRQESNGSRSIKTEEASDAELSAAEDSTTTPEMPVAVKFFVPLLGQEKSVSFKSLTKCKSRKNAKKVLNTILL